MAACALPVPVPYGAPSKTPAEQTAAEAAQKTAEETHVVILCTSDMHGNILGYSYEDNCETDNNGMARLYTYIEQVRKENPIVFLVDAGDDIQGTIMTDDIANKEPDSAHPVMAAMNYMGYDSMTLGNHEFNWGIETMKKITGQADFPVLGANVLDKDGNYVTGKGYTIIEREGVKLAVIGVCTPDVPIWDENKEGIADTTFEAANVSVKKVLEEIKDQTDIILVSAHMGQHAEFDEDGGSDSGEKIVEDNPEVDILQAAHLHITVNDKIGETPIVAVRNSGREIARVDVTLDQDKKIKDIKTEIVDMADYEPSEEIREIPVVKEFHERAVSMATGGAGKDGESGTPLGSTTSKFQPENEIMGLPEGRLKDTAVIDLILNIELLNSGADVASCALFKDTSDLPEGSIYYSNILDIYKYDNTLYTLDVTGKELKDYMEWSAECYNQWVPGDINVSFDPEYPDYLYDMFAGVDYEINLSRPKGERIENVLFKGEPLKDDQVLKLAVNNYRYSSCLKAYDIAEGKRDWESSNSIRDMIVKYFAENSPVEPIIDNNWRITGIDLSVNDERREEIINYINEGLLPTPYNSSYNLSEYDELVAQAQANKAAGITVEAHASH
ncbi:MAG: 5'-nucleotidase C-terminal domain-containing protein [Lachnospiraceae bacterium]|nr:5'-nucleotidase C-terminal domain-containing protein [Lachnospiraceae bacterium]